MNKLGLKYINNKLTSDELLQLRYLVRNSSDSDISSEMKEVWETHDNLVEVVPLRCKRKVMSRVHRINTHSKSVRFLRYAAVSIAAVLIPALIISTVYLYNEVQYEGDKLVEVSTGAGERANITLPDGTKVSLNFYSKLSYSPHTFGKKERNVTFDGEAYFDVVHNEKSKFTITDEDISVRVIGTKFNLLSRKGTQFVTINMEQGRVAFSALYGKAHCELVEDQSAIFDRNTGNITVTNYNKSSVAMWRHKELVFHNITLIEVLRNISSAYGVEITIEGTVSTSEDLFTGSIPATNILEAMEVVERAYHVKATILNNQVIITETL